MKCCESSDKSQNTPQQVRRKTQRQSDIKKVQSSMNQNQNRAKQQFLSVSSFQAELDGELKMNSKTLKQYMRFIDKVSTFEQYHSFISNHPLEIVSKSICAYFEKILGKNEDHGLLAARLCEPYQLYAQIKKSFKFITLGLVYFLQKIDEGMSEEGLRMDCDFQTRKRQLRQNEAYICERIQAILKKENIFRGRMAEKQQRIRRLKDEINLKDQLSIFNILSLATRSERNIEDIIFAQIKILHQEILQIKEEYSNETMKQFIKKIVDFSRRIEQFRNNQINIEFTKIDQNELNQQAKLKEQLTVKQNQIFRLKNENSLLIKTQKDQISKNSSWQISQLNTLHKMEMKKLQDIQTMLNKQNSTLKIEAQRLQKYIKQIEASCKAKDDEIVKINVKLKKNISNQAAENQKNISALKQLKQMNKKNEMLVRQIQTETKQRKRYARQLEQMNNSLLDLNFDG